MRVKNPEREMELWEHLSELRGRIFRAILYIVVGMVICWAFYDPLFTFLNEPLKAAVKDLNFQYINITEPFMVRMQVSLVGGLILALPLLTLEMWGFVAPGLTREERRGFHLIVPLSILFFLAGVTTAYLILPNAFRWFASFLTPGTKLEQNPLRYIVFVVKMMLGFGLVFQLPVVLMFLAWVGIVTSRTLKENWRTALVLASVVGAIATPSQDPLTMLIMAVPLGGLYFASIWLVGIVERMKSRQALQESAGMGTP